MKLFRFLNPSVYYYNLILFISFCISINYFSEIEYINSIFYVIFHISLTYLVFYYYHYLFYIIAFFYGLFLDIFLVNLIGPHLITFLLFFSFFSIIRKNLFKFSSIKITYIIFLFVILILLFEMLISSIIFNYSFIFYNFFELFVIGAIIFFPVILLFSKLDNL